MNGDFEIDKSAYPFNGVRFGDNTFLVYVPNMEKLFDVALPPAVAAQAALGINTMYWAAKAGGSKFDGTSSATKAHVRIAARHEFVQGNLTGEQLQQLVEKLKD